MITKKKGSTVSTSVEPDRPLRGHKESILEPPEPRAVSVSGSLFEALRVVSRTTAELHLLTGRTEGKDRESLEKVLLPFAEIRFIGGKLEDLQNTDGSAETSEDNTEPPTLISATLSLENMAFMILDLMSDLRGVCEEVSLLARGDLAVDPGRMAQVRYFVAHLEQQARMCRARLDDVYGKPR